MPKFAGYLRETKRDFFRSRAHGKQFLTAGDIVQHSEGRCKGNIAAQKTSRISMRERVSRPGNYAKNTAAVT